jgi:hypothetical protein
VRGSCVTSGKVMLDGAPSHIGGEVSEFLIILKTSCIILLSDLQNDCDR